MTEIEIALGPLEGIDDPGCREFSIGDGDWPFKGFVVRQGDTVYAYENYCRHLGHPLNWSPEGFLSKDRQQIICASHGALYEIASGKCIGGPCLGKELRRVACEIRDGKVIVRGPDSA